MSNSEKRAGGADGDGTEFGGKQIGKRQAAIAVMAAANRNPERFPDPNRFDFRRPDNRHLAFGYAAHFCFGAPSARAEGQIAFEVKLRRLNKLVLSPNHLCGGIIWACVGSCHCASHSEKRAAQVTQIQAARRLKHRRPSWAEVGGPEGKCRVP